MAAAPPVAMREIFRRFWPYARPQRRMLCLSLVFVIASPAVDTATVWIYKRLIDEVVAPRDLGAFGPIALAYVGLTLLAGAVSIGDRSLSGWVGQRFLVALRTAFFRHLQGLSLDFFERRRLGDVLSRLTSDITAIESFVLSGAVDALSYGLRILFFVGALFWVEWHLAIVVTATASLFWLVTRIFAGRIKNASREKRRRAGAIGALAEESLGNAALVQAYNREDAEVLRFHQENVRSFEAEMVSTRLKAIFSPLVDMVELGGVLGVVAVGTWELAQGAVSVGGLLVFLAFLTRLYAPIRGIAGLSNSVYSASAAAERIIEFFDQHPAVPRHPDATPLAGVQGAITFDRVSFTYPGTASPAISELSFHVAPGEMVALVGASGAGKSSIARLLMRFYDPGAGRVLLDGMDLRDIDLQSLRDHVAVVLQETLVFDGTIRENIAYGRPGATDADIVEAARASDAHAFIDALPDGYDTQIGQKGRRLSGGQRQRIAIARAMIRQARILLLDEPTTGLDDESGRRIMAPLRRLTSGRTSIVISHNLLTVRDATCILVLEGGRVVERGTHTRLLELNGVYARLYRLSRADDHAEHARHLSVPV